jgi:PKHD-type hydroxylase
MVFNQFLIGEHIMYKTIYNAPFERENVTFPWTYWDGAFNDEELDNIVKSFEENGLDDSTIIGTSDPDEVGKVRRSKVKFHDLNNNTDWIFSRFNDVIEKLNARFYNYNLNGYDKIQYTVYDGEDGGKYDWHQDMPHGPQVITPTRKLSVVMNLSKQDEDYQGGEFQILLGTNPETVSLPRGRIIAFPAYLLHRVAPLTQGVRKSLVIWVIGPKFI